MRYSLLALYVRVSLAVYTTAEKTQAIRNEGTYSSGEGGGARHVIPDLRYERKGAGHSRANIIDGTRKKKKKKASRASYTLRV